MQEVVKVTKQQRQRQLPGRCIKGRYGCQHASVITYCLRRLGIGVEIGPGMKSTSKWDSTGSLHLFLLHLLSHAVVDFVFV